MRTTSPFLSHEQHTRLLRLICDGVVSPVVRKRAAILLLLHGGQNQQGMHGPAQEMAEVAKQADCSVRLVLSTQQRFATGGMQEALSP